MRAMLSLPLPHVASLIFNIPLMIAPAKLDAIIVGLGPRFGLPPESLPQTTDLFTTASGEYRRPGYRVVDGVGVIDVMGILAHRGGLQADSSYVLGYQQAARMLAAAVADPEVGGIVLNLDSPGGASNGAFDFADQVRAAAQIKPVHAAVGDLALSAGYLIASSAQRIGMTRTAMVGSIGVVMRHLDLSTALAKEGVRVTHIFAGAHKLDGNPYEPLPAAVRDEFQRQINGIYDLFVGHVAATRNMTPDEVRATEAGVFTGNEAINTGLADVMATPDEMISEMAAAIKRAKSSKPRAAANAAKRSVKMEQDEAVVTMTPEAYAKALADAKAAGYDDGLARGAEQECARIKDVEAQALPGHIDLIRTLMYDGKTTGPMAAVAVLKAEREALSKMDALIKSDAPKPLPAAPAPTNDVRSSVADDGKSIEDRCKARWDSDADIRAEFGEFPLYLSFERANSSGKVRILRGKQA